MDENDIICWHWEHSKGRSVKGMNLLTAFYVCEKDGKTIRIPIDFRIIAKTEEYDDLKTGKRKRRSPLSKNQMMQEMIAQAIQNNVKFRYILADSWFSSNENMKFAQDKGKTFIMELKTNRVGALSEADKKKKLFTSVDNLGLLNETPVQVWFKELPFPVSLCKQVFNNKDGSVGVRYLVTNALAMTREQFTTIYKIRWSVEEYHKSIKQNVAVGASPAHTVQTQSNHVFVSIFTYGKLELLSISKKLNHFALKSKLCMAASRVSMSLLWSIAT
ncbi:transposase [Breznakiellaceae bacterium SP9]